MADRWVWCVVRSTPEVEPDWTRVPEAKRETVRARWRAANETAERWQLWEPQIPMYRRLGYGVEVEG